MNFLAEAYKDGNHAAEWFATWAEAQKWVDAKKPDWWQITPRATVERQKAEIKGTALSVRLTRTTKYWR